MERRCNVIDAEKSVWRFRVLLVAFVAILSTTIATAQDPDMLKAEQAAHLKAGQVITIYGDMAETKAKRGYQQRPRVDTRLDGAELK
jgi:hypothetical protein